MELLVRYSFFGSVIVSVVVCVDFSWVVILSVDVCVCEYYWEC